MYQQLTMKATIHNRRFRQPRLTKIHNSNNLTTRATRLRTQQVWLHSCVHRASPSRSEVAEVMHLLRPIMLQPQHSLGRTQLTRMVSSNSSMQRCSAAVTVSSLVSFTDITTIAEQWKVCIQTLERFRCNQLIRTIRRGLMGRVLDLQG